jgi:predicted nucleic acid-binding protein
LLRGTREEQALRRWLRRAEPLVTSAVAWAEFLCGPLEEEDSRLAETIVTDRLLFVEQGRRGGGGALQSD